MQLLLYSTYYNYWIWGIILLPGIIFAMYAQFKISSAYNRYSKMQSKSGRTAFEVARSILNCANLHHIKVVRVSGQLSDHYDHSKKRVALSSGVYDSSSISALGIMAHEVGHAIQYKKKYFPIVVRNFLVPVSNFVSQLLWPVIFIGLALNYMATVSPIGTFMIYAGIGMFGLTTLVSLVTLPVEFNASKRAIEILKETNILDREELVYSKEVLDAAALTYVAGLVMSLLYLLRFVLAFSRRN